MRSKVRLSCALAVLLLCGMLRPAFADGAMGVYDALAEAMIIGIVIVGVIVAAIIVFFVRRARRRRAVVRRGDQAVPAARVVKDPLKRS
jgi:uncharacterized membrane protein YedE/YeeE